MASMTRVDSGSTTTYTITDNGGSTLTVTMTVNSITGNTAAFTSSGAVRPDGLAMLSFILGALVTGILPQSQTPSF
jgi:hypothetical protein